MMEVKAVSEGRRITLDPLATFPIEMELREVESTIPAGFQMEWISGEDTETGTKFEMLAGAGVGSKYLTFSYGERAFVVDMKATLEKMIEAVAPRGEEEE
jgi:hypothetical protein